MNEASKAYILSEKDVIFFLEPSYITKLLEVWFLKTPENGCPSTLENKVQQNMTTKLLINL